MSEALPPGSAWLESSEGERTTLRGNCSLGRSSGNTIVVRSDRASRQHATIHAQDGGEYWIIDLGSSNGTLLNDVRVSLPTRLRAGDRLQIAGFTWVFRQLDGAGTDSEAFAESMMTIAEIRQARCWLLIADVQEFTPLSQRLSPEELAGLMGGWVRACREILAAHGGTLNKYLGDGFLAYWREAAGTSTKVAGAIADFQLMQTKKDLEFRLVLHRGQVALGGASNLGEESLMGPEVNYVFRLEKLAGSLKTQCAFSSAAAEGLGSALPTRPLDGEHELKGFSGFHRLFVPRT